jgi:hypothetical protein
MVEDGMINIIWDRKELQEDMYKKGQEERQMMSTHGRMAWRYKHLPEQQLSKLVLAGIRSRCIFGRSGILSLMG